MEIDTWSITNARVLDVNSLSLLDYKFQSKYDIKSTIHIGLEVSLIGKWGLWIMLVASLYLLCYLNTKKTGLWFSSAGLWRFLSLKFIAIHHFWVDALYLEQFFVERGKKCLCLFINKVVYRRYIAPILTASLNK